MSRLRKLWLCWSASFLLVPAWAAQKGDLSRLVVVGDSLSAGFQSGSLLDGIQQNGYASLIAKQAGVQLPLPLIAPPGIPPILAITNPGPPPVINPVAPPPAYGIRENPTVQPMNLSVPGQAVTDSLLAYPFKPLIPPLNQATYVPWMTYEILGFPNPGTQVQQALRLNPSSIVLFIGNNDALGPAMNGSGLATPPILFQTLYTLIFQQLQKQGRGLIVATIPDITLTPFFVPAPIAAAEISAWTGIPATTVSASLGIAPGDYVLIDVLPTVIQTLQATGRLPRLTDSQKLDAGEAQNIRSAITQYNKVISDLAKRADAVLADVNALVSSIAKNGYVVHDPSGAPHTLTTAFLAGLFSLDGIHPTNTAYAVIANTFINAINAKWGTQIPQVNVDMVAAMDPFVFGSPGLQATGLAHIDKDALAGLRAVLQGRGTAERQ